MRRHDPFVLWRTVDRLGRLQDAAVGIELGRRAAVAWLYGDTRWSITQSVPIDQRYPRQLTL